MNKSEVEAKRLVDTLAAGGDFYEFMRDFSDTQWRFTANPHNRGLYVGAVIRELKSRGFQLRFWG